MTLGRILGAVVFSVACSGVAYAQTPDPVACETQANQRKAAWATTEHSWFETMLELQARDLELSLCRAHVALMRERLELDLALRASGIDPSDTVPPALFHTLIENALTHGRFAGPAELTLDAERTGARRRYRLVSPESAPAPAAREGTGLRYVRARLQDCCGDRWRLRSTDRTRHQQEWEQEQNDTICTSHEEAPFVLHRSVHYKL